MGSPPKLPTGENRMAQNDNDVLTEPTTAELLGQYQQELRAEGFDWDFVDDLVRDLARNIHGRYPITVGPKADDPALDDVTKAERRLQRAIDTAARRERAGAEEIAAAQHALSEARRAAERANPNGV